MKDNRSFFEKLTGAGQPDYDDEEISLPPKSASISRSTPSQSLSQFVSDDPEEGELTVDVYQTATHVIIKTMVAGATGIAVGIGGKLVALELFDAASTLVEQWPRLVEGAASACADHRRPAEPPRAAAACPAWHRSSPLRRPDR